MERMTTAGIAIRNGLVLVAKRIDGGSLSGKWEFPGGKNRYGESLEETLRREFLEELSVPVSVGKDVFLHDFRNGSVLYHLHAFLVTLEEDSFTLSVHTETRWVDGNELAVLDMGMSDSAVREFVIANLLHSLPDSCN